MTDRERQLRQDVSDLKDAAQALMDEGKQKEARAKLDEAKAKKSELDNFIALQKDFQGITLPDVNNNGAQMQPEPKKDEAKEYKGLFFKAIRGKAMTDEELDIMDQYKARLSSKEGEDGGYIIPEDIQTKINKLRQSRDDLRQYVTVVPVSTNKGARTLEKRAEHTPFAPLSEYGDPNAMKEIESPQFDRLSYAIEDYAGFLPVPNNVLDDTDQALEEYLIDWIGKKGKATDNHLILQVVNGFVKKKLDDYKGIKTIINVELDPAFLDDTRIYTNQDGFNYLDQLEDGNGRPLLQPDPTRPTGKLLHGYQVVVLSNKTIKTEANLAPVIIGALEEAVVLWDRKQLSIDMTKEGGQAWRTNTTEFRAIQREDVTKWDEEAVVYAQLDITKPAPEEIPEG
ncbi:phage major capsid protein [Pseudogracilibacillus auburnensis]|uniref:phage major capsid protein n=1 Tax=Pseudogracilibacillus auburnensis TaxID=1494959 RepID=UPI001A977882|nr:phage major capsid protein [Pseudogracilibacillus auburnensis]MBO1003742.1 phage major capsid protein [Pseudogracilibacillus auburnensis]